MDKFKENDRVVFLTEEHMGTVGTVKEKSSVYRIETDNGDPIWVPESKLGFENIMNEPVDEISHDTNSCFIEMATVKGGFMSIKIAIYGSEGKYPHFHFYKGIASKQGIPKEKRGGGGCICIDSANYFMHGSHTDTMDRKEIDGLIKFLKSPHKLLKEYTNWEYIISEWDQNNPDQKQLPIDLPIPDYKHNMGSIQERS